MITTILLFPNLSLGILGIVWVMLFAIQSPVIPLNQPIETSAWSYDDTPPLDYTWSISLPLANE